MQRRKPLNLKIIIPAIISGAAIVFCFPPYDYGWLAFFALVPLISILRGQTRGRAFLSGMLFGYRFRYVPSDRARGISEEFELVPIAEIAWGDPALEIAWIQEREHKVWAGVSYRLAEYQADRIRSWQSNVMPTATGRGERPLIRGRAEKMGSVEEAIKQAIRQHARGKIPNKPRELAGDVVIWAPPQTVVGSGQYITTVQIKLFLQEIRPYTVY